MLDGLGDGGQGVLAPAQVGQPVGQVVQRRGEVGQEGVGAGGGQLAGGCSTASVIAARASSRRPRSASAVGQVVQRRGEVGQEGVGAGGGQLPVDRRRPR